MREIWYTTGVNLNKIDGRGDVFSIPRPDRTLIGGFDMPDLTPQLPQTKKCTKCRESKPATTEYFSRHKTGKYGINSRCKACESERGRAYREANRKRERERMRAWRVANPERAAEMARAWHAANRERELERQRAWAKANPDRRAENHARARAKHPNRIVARHAVSYAVRSGRMPSPRDLTCTVCGVPAEHYHHHNGYKPEHSMDVVPVCRACHIELHKEEL